MNKELHKFMQTLKAAREYLTRQQLLTFKGQALAGDVEGARKGLIKVIGRRIA